MHRWILLGLALTFLPSSAFAQREFGFDNRKPSGQPYLAAEETVKQFKLLDGWQANVFAAEPDVINPIAFTIDEKGRYWVVECFEYPSRTPKGKKPRDRIKILEDTDGDGKVDKVTIWAEGKDLPIGWDLASGIEVGHGGVYLGAPPYLFFLSDPGNTGKCTKQEILLKGFGSQDTHETLNTLQWGPDGWLYGLHGVFTHSEVDGVKMNAAVWRYESPFSPASKNRGGDGKGKFEIFAEGTSNPWGMDFDRHGQCFLCCCVIPHLFHMVPGGTYKRQAGSSFNPYAYGLLNEICDHTHHKLSGWAHAGLIVLEGEHIPKEQRGNLVMGSIHGCSLKTNTLKPNGSTFIGSSAPDFLVSGDKNVRPINLRWGPDGAIYCIDWHDQNPCHQAAPDSWDQTHGRIYRLAPKGHKGDAAVDLSKLKTRELAGLLKRDNPYWHRTALRLLAERKDPSPCPELFHMLKESADDAHALRGLWGARACGLWFPKTTLEHKSPWVRSWGIRLLGEDGERNDEGGPGKAGQISGAMLKQLAKMAAEDPAPQVRLQLASTCQNLKDRDGTLAILHNLMKHKEDKKDPYLPLMIWLAYEPQVVGKKSSALDWLKDNAAGNALVTDEIVPRTMRRLIATGKKEDLESCVQFLAQVPAHDVRKKALEALVSAIKTPVEAPPSWSATLVVLNRTGDAAVRELSQRLAVKFQDPRAIARALSQARDTQAALPQRLDAVRDLAAIVPADGEKVLLALALSKKEANELRAEAIRALAGYDAPLAQDLLAVWKEMPPSVRGEAVNLLSARKSWAKDLLAGVGKGNVARADLNDNTIIRILGFKDKALSDQVEKVWGRFRDSPKELAALIDKMRGELHQGSASFERGRKVFELQCAKCHKFEGKGYGVGPELDGAARDIEYLLANILDPNRVIGQPYLLRLAELKGGRVETGLLHAEDEQSITLKVENDQLKTIRRKDIEGKVEVLNKSMMPEGLANNMSVQDFRDLVRYVMAHPFLTEFKVLDQTVRVGPAGRVPLGDLQPGVSASNPFLVHVEASQPLKTRLLLGTNHPVTVYLNDDKIGVVKGAPGAPLQPDMVGINVDLKKGTNKLILAVEHQGRGQAFYARLLDPNRALRYP